MMQSSSTGTAPACRNDNDDVNDVLEQQQEDVIAADVTTTIQQQHNNNNNNNNTTSCIYNNFFLLLFINELAAIIIFIRHLVKLESIVSIILSVVMTIYVYQRTKDDSQEETSSSTTFDGSTMTWVLLSFAVIIPIGQAIRMAFTRRELSLQYIATIKSTFILIYTSHAMWDWGNYGRTNNNKNNIDWLQHSDDACNEILAICNDLTSLLIMPIFTRSRHKTIPIYQKEAEYAKQNVINLYNNIIIHFARLTDLCEVLKREGLPPNEATRIRQWERIILDNIEKLRMIKIYRTPQGLRSFARLFSIYMPPFYSPYYAQMAHDLNSLGIAIAFAILTSIALTALFETVSQIEDPFDMNCIVLDGINVQEELIYHFKSQILTLRKQFYPNSGDFERKINVLTKSGM